MIQKGSIRAKMLGGLAAVALIAVACSNSGASTAPSSGASAGASGGATGSYKIGFANGGGVGNGWRERDGANAHDRLHRIGRSSDRRPRPMLA